MLIISIDERNGEYVLTGSVKHPPMDWLNLNSAVIDELSLWKVEREISKQNHEAIQSVLTESDFPKKPWIPGWKIPRLRRVG